MLIGLGGGDGRHAAVGCGMATVGTATREASRMAVGYIIT